MAINKLKKELASLIIRGKYNSKCKSSGSTLYSVTYTNGVTFLVLVKNGRIVNYS